MVKFKLIQIHKLFLKQVGKIEFILIFLMTFLVVENDDLNDFYLALMDGWNGIIWNPNEDEDEFSEIKSLPELTDEINDSMTCFSDRHENDDGMTFWLFGLPLQKQEGDVIQYLHNLLLP